MKKDLAPVPLNKAKNYYEDKDSNTTIPMSYQGIKTFAILDSGAGLAIATKGIWESWGRLVLEKQG